MTERGSLQASWQSIRPLITVVALLSACEVAVLVKKNCLFTEGASNTGGVEVWSGYEGVQSPPGLCSQQSRKAPSVIGGPTMKEHSTVFCCCCFFLQYIHVSLRNTSKLTGSCHNRQVGGDALFLGQRVDLYFRPLLTDENLNIVIIGN